MQPSIVRIGIISDTHGLLRKQALQALQGVDDIIHAGDIGDPKILEALANIAPVIAVRGNNDSAEWATDLPVTETREIDGLKIHVLHDVHELHSDWEDASYQVVISGHSHKPLLKSENETLFINPGSAGPRRFKLPVSVALLEILDGKPVAEINILEI